MIFYVEMILFFKIILLFDNFSDKLFIELNYEFDNF